MDVPHFFSALTAVLYQLRFSSNILQTLSGLRGGLLAQADKTDTRQEISNNRFSKRIKAIVVGREFARQKIRHGKVPQREQQFFPFS